ncbi:O-antigen ligase family protein [Candidatus Foliamicus sp.]
MFRALMALVLLAPLPLGAYATWAWTAGAVVCGVLLAAWGALALRGLLAVTTPPPFLLWATLAMAMAMAWALLQTAGFMPETWHHPIWLTSAEALGTPYRGTISLDPAAGRESILRMAANSGVFWLAFQYGSDPRRAWRILRALAVCASCYASFGLIMTLSDAGRIPWFDNSRFPGQVTATFVNPNSWATYCGIGLLCATAVIRHRFARSTAYLDGLRTRLYVLLTEFIPRNTLLLAGWLVLASALLLSLSRGGVAATVLALLVFTWLLALQRPQRARALAMRTLVTAMAGAALLLLAGGGLARHFGEADSDWAARAEIYTLTIQAIREKPLLGTGLGTYASIYRSLRTEGIRPGVTRAHNDYLELAVELGIPAALLILAAMAALAIGCARGVLARRRDAELPAVGAAGCALVGAHSFLDFSLQLPAIAATFSLLFGAAVAQARGRLTAGSASVMRNSRPDAG